MREVTQNAMKEIVSKVPAATAGFWILKLIATTVGEIGGNLASMDFALGYLEATAILFTLFAVLAAAQVAASRFRPGLYWATIVASTTAGTTLADFATRSIGLGYTGGTLLLFGLVLLSLASWKRDLGKVSSDLIVGRRPELHYWTTITFSQTLGTALGDWFADTAGLGYAGSSLVLGAALAVIAALYFLGRGNRVILFWVAFVLTRPFGAVFGNLFDKPIEQGGYGMDRMALTIGLIAIMAVGLLVIPQHAKRISSKRAFKDPTATAG